MHFLGIELNAKVEDQELQLQGLKEYILEGMIGLYHYQKRREWMSTSTNKHKKRAFLVKAIDTGGKTVAEYLFASMKEAVKFELHMRNQRYTTEMHRKWV